jgi:glucose/mannose-6-phosphate isomerase
MPDNEYLLLDHLQEPGRFAALDPHDMLGLVLKFPQQCREAVQIGSQLKQTPVSSTEIHQVVLTGMGGSAIGGDFANSLMDHQGAVPLIVNRDYTLPRWVDPHTLVLAASYSGNTEETLAAYAAARASGAQIAVITSGGQLRERAVADGVPVALVPGGQPPRSATGYIFFPLIACLRQHHLLVRDLTPDIEETLHLLEELAGQWGPTISTDRNPAKQLAIALDGRLPVIYGSQGYRGAVAYRWKSQFNENAKQAAFANVFPEQNHNEILAWTLANRQTSNWSVVFLRDPEEREQLPHIAFRVETTRRIIGEEVPFHDVWAQGKSLLARLFSLVYFADFVTVYLAYLNGICPTDIQAIDQLKAELPKSD